jgi:hypothetical protein
MLAHFLGDPSYQQATTAERECCVPQSRSLLETDVVHDAGSQRECTMCRLRAHSVGQIRELSGRAQVFHFVAPPLLRNMLHLLSLCSAPLQLLLPHIPSSYSHWRSCHNPRRSRALTARVRASSSCRPLCEAGGEEKKSSRQEIYGATKSTRRYLLNQLGFWASTLTCTSNSSPSFNTSG